MFDKFKDYDCKVQDKLKSDVRCMLSLYQASQLREQGENILEEALTFTTYVPFESFLITSESQNLQNN